MSTAIIGERRSFDGQLCTIRYVGSVRGTSGDWLGVEWDDPTRGKHSGEHKGVRYFTCMEDSFQRLSSLLIISQAKAISQQQGHLSGPLGHQRPRGASYRH